MNSGLVHILLLGLAVVVVVGVGFGQSERGQR